MKKYLLLLLLSVVCLQDIYANHTKGGWMYYQYLGQGINDPTKLRYRIGLNFFVECNTPVGEQPWFFSFFDGAAPYNFLQDIPVSPTPFIQIAGCTTTNCYPCLSNIPTRCYQISNYEIIVELDPNPNGYIVSKQRCCRVMNISNIQPPSQDRGATYTIKIPGTADIPNGPQNSSPQFIFNDTVVVCGDAFFAMSFQATDPDADSLSYSFIDAYDGGSPGNSSPVPASNPPYNNIPYAFPFNGAQPLGTGVTIDPITGLISGIAPASGIYVICVLVREYRNGILFAESRKELHLDVATCFPLTATSNFVPITCDGFTVNFTESSTGNPNTFFWDFGDPASGVNNTSTLQNPTHTFTDTGVFNVKLVISISGQCIDSIIKPIRVYPGFLPGFINTAPCVNTPVQFTDTTYSRYGLVNSWRWDFGDPATLADTSHLQNPVYTYSAPGNYTVQLRVTNDKGCDTLYNKIITIFANPLLSVFPADSIYCGLDTLQLNGVGAGAFSWTPPINIIGANTATPQVFPTTTTWYYTTLTDANGCKSRDSLRVIPKFDLSNNITGPINICEEDTVTLNGSSNYSNNLTWQWSPAATVESPTDDTTRVYPIVTSTYTLRTRWGNNCIATKTHTITVRPLAIPNAGPDAFVCGGGQASTQLNASGGNSYSWTPTTGLSNANIPNPIATPTVPTNYVVAVGVTGCPKLRTDTVFVDVGAVPAISMLNDTLICTIDTLQLTTGGTGTFAWSPNYMISNTAIASPLVSPDVPTWYYVTLTDAVGCKNRDSVFVDVKAGVSLSAGADTTICQTDGFFLNTVSDGLYYQWTPTTYLNNGTIKNPFATPLNSITYRVRASIGKCFSEDEVSIKVVPYPPANAGPDSYLCTGFSAQLNASGGSSYAWSPPTFLTNRLIPNPVSVRPTANIQYIVTVRDTLGCPKPVKDTVWIRVYPAVVADAGPRDTTVVLGQPLFLNASGGATYVWSPSTWLNNPNIANPVSLPQDDIEYILVATSAQGCIGTDSIFVHLYKMDEDIYVPNAFTPNGDGNNDVLRPILLGMKELGYFRVYNRWGVLMFSTSEKGRGWDGRYNGKAQDPAAYVWEAEGITFRGLKKKKKGSAVLIR
jgi:gliding motility-associated-like protein